MVAVEEILKEIKSLFERNQDTGHRTRKYKCRGWSSQFFDMSQKGFQLAVIQVERYDGKRIQFGAILKWERVGGIDNLIIDAAFFNGNERFKKTMSQKYSSKPGRRKGVLWEDIDKRMPVQFGWGEIVDLIRQFAKSVPNTRRR